MSRTRELNLKHIVYKITNDIDDTYYIGIHKTNIDIDDGYRGSGPLIKLKVLKYGKEHFKRETLFIYDTLEEAAAKEKELVNDELLSDPNCLNQVYGGGKGWEYINKQVKSGEREPPMKGKFHTDKSKEKISKNHYDCSGKNNSMYRSSENWVTYTDGISNIKVGNDLYSFWLPKGFYEGKFKNKHKKKIEVLVVPDIHSKKYILDKFIKLIRSDRFYKIIFLGDYIDGFTESNEDMLYCLNTVINLKKEYKDRIILLLANHEYSYLYAPCSGHRFDIENKVKSILLENKNLFQICYAINRCIFSHAGITNQWINQLYNNEFKLTEYYDFNYKIQGLCNNINNCLFDLSLPGFYRSGGECFDGGSCIWVDKKELIIDSLDRCDQVVGHTPVKSVTINKVSKNKLNNHFITFTDTFSTYRDGTIYGDQSYLVFQPTAKRRELMFNIEYL